MKTHLPNDREQASSSAAAQKKAPVTSGSTAENPAQLLKKSSGVVQRAHNPTPTPQEIKDYKNMYGMEEKEVRKYFMDRYLQDKVKESQGPKTKGLKFGPNSKEKRKYEEKGLPIDYTSKGEKVNDAFKYSSYAGKGADAGSKAADFMQGTSNLANMAQYSGLFGDALGIAKSASDVKADKDRIKSGQLNPEEVERTQKNIDSNKSTMAVNTTNAANTAGAGLGSTLLSKAGPLTGGLVNMYAGGKMEKSGEASMDAYINRMHELSLLLEKKDKSERFEQISAILAEILKVKVDASDALKKSGKANKDGGKVMAAGLVFHPLLLAGMGYTFAKSGKASLDTYLTSNHTKKSIGINAAMGKYDGVTNPDHIKEKNPSKVYQQVVIDVADLLGKSWGDQDNERHSLLNVIGLKKEAKREEILKVLKI